MVPIALEDIAAFHVTALDLYKQHEDTLRSGVGQPIFDFSLSVDRELHHKLAICWTKAKALLNGLLSQRDPPCDTCKGPILE
jgi:hypothetical protein